MGEGHSEKLAKSIRWYLLVWLISSGTVVIGLFWLLQDVLNLNEYIVLVSLVLVWILFSVGAAVLITRRIYQPLGFLAQAILHISPAEHLVAAPNPDDLKMGRELVASLTRQIYEFASTDRSVTNDQQQNLQNNLIQQLPVPLIGLGTDQKIIFANSTAQIYSGKESNVTSQDFSTMFNLSFPGEEDLTKWVEQCRQKSVSSTKSWAKVRLDIAGGDPKYFDLAAHFSKDSPSGIEVVLAFFDNTERYSWEDRSIGFIALAVHELRTPLTILRGYIEIFEDELGGELTPEMKDFMQKMQASAESLTAFVNNILSVARVDQKQLSLKLAEEQWEPILSRAVDDMRLRAGVRNVSLELQVAPNLPTVAVDNISIREVINNLLDNAIKYSKGNPRIVVQSKLSQDGNIETTVQDFGVGIPTVVMPHLFEKFVRNHRNKTQIAGTGLGLYLSKAIVNAHYGNIWGRSQEGQGSIFGFTLQPYTKLAEQIKSEDNKDIIRSSHGWIKNHSMSRQ